MVQRLLVILLLSVSAAAQGGVLGAISYPSSGFKEWHFVLIGGKALPDQVQAQSYWSYQHKTFTLQATNLWLCVPGCTFTGKITAKLAPESLSSYCWQNNRVLLGTFTNPKGDVFEGVRATYSQTECLRNRAYSLGGGDLTVEIE